MAPTALVQAGSCGPNVLALRPPWDAASYVEGTTASAAGTTWKLAFVAASKVDVDWTLQVLAAAGISATGDHATNEQEFLLLLNEQPDGVVADDSIPELPIRRALVHGA